jgi:hypothetical protein
MVMRFLLCPNLLCAYSNPNTILSEEVTSVKKENNIFPAIPTAAFRASRAVLASAISSPLFLPKR